MSRCTCQNPIYLCKDCGGLSPEEGEKWLRHETVSRVLASGRLSNWFIDTDEFFKDIKIRDMIVEHWAKRILKDLESDSKKEARIFGVPTGGVGWAKALWFRLGDRSLLLHEYRDRRYAENTYIVDDVLTTGSTIKELGASGEPVLCVVRRLAPNCPMLLDSPIRSWMHVQLPIGDR